MKETMYAAVLEDCNELIDRLETREIMNFDVFAEVWREMTFSLIFRGRTRELDMLDLCETLLLAAKTCWLPPNSPERRLLAAYLVYGTYFKQPFRGVAKIKVTRPDWDEIVDYVKFLVEKNLWEHIYMFSQLFEHEAFMFCHTACESLVEKHKAMEMLYMLNEQRLAPRVSSDITKLIRSGIFDNIANAADNYEAEKLFGIERNLIPRQSMPIATDGLNLGQELRNLCLRRSLVKNTHQNKPSFKTKPKKTHMASIGSRRRALKQLCMSKVGVPRCARLRLGADNVVTEEQMTPAQSRQETVKQRKRRERGYYLTTRFKQHRDLEGFPIEGMYDVIHSMNSRALYQKVLPKIRSSSNKKSQLQGGENLSMDKNDVKMLRRSYSLGAQYVNTDTMSQAEKDLMEAGPSIRPDGPLYRNWSSEEDLSAAETNYYGYPPKDQSCTEDLSQSELSMPELD